MHPKVKFPPRAKHPTLQRPNVISPDARSGERWRWEADKEFNNKGAVNSAIPAAKHAQRPRRIGEEAPRPSFGKKNRKDAGKRKKSGHTSAKTKVFAKDSKFKAEMGMKRLGGAGGTAEGIRAERGGEAGGAEVEGRRWFLCFAAS